jgi:hypothetical protein
VKPATPVSVADLMRDIENGVRRDRRTRLVARGGPPEYQDQEIYAAVEAALRRALESRNLDVLLIPEIVSDEADWRLQTHLTFSSHRGAIGSVIVWVKRRVLLPLTRWLYEYALENFKRQERVNRALFACIEELAIENAKIRRELQDCRIAGLQEVRDKGEVGNTGRGETR